MRRVIKSAESQIIKQNIIYKIKGDNSKIKDILLSEQNSICAYTEEYIGRADKAEIDHFNPNLKGNQIDSYENWFLVKGQWNLEKSRKWNNYQPILYPTNHDFEERIIYEQGNYLVEDKNDIEARNLYSLLNLGDEKLAFERKSYILRMRKDIENMGMSPQDFFDELISDYSKHVYFIRAIEAEFQVKIKFPK